MNSNVIQAEERCSFPTARTTDTSNSYYLLKGYEAHTHHRLVRVLLELHESDPSHVLHLDVTIGTLEVVSAV